MIQLTFEKKLNKVNACKDPSMEYSKSQFQHGKNLRVVTPIFKTSKMWTN